jgi:hypothetical protein
MNEESDLRSLKRRQNLFDKVLKSGKTISELQSLSRIEYNKIMGTKAKNKKSLAGQHRLLNQLNYHVKDVADYHIKKNKIVNKSYKSFVNEEGRKLVKLEGDYTILEVRYSSDNSKWIKYADKSSLTEQLKKLEASYGKNYELIYYDFKKYAGFLESQFDKMISQKGIKI